MVEIGGANLLTQTKVKDIDYIIPKQVPTRQNYVFVGWSKNPDLSTTYFLAGMEYTYSDNANLNLYAIWTLKEVKIEYNENGGTLVYPNPQYKRLWRNSNIS